LSSYILQEPVDALVMSNGKIQVDGAPDRLLTLSQVAEQASPNNCPKDMEPGLEITYYFRCSHMTYAHGATVVEVEVDTDTGAVTPKHIWIVYDVGTAINPRMVAGQVEGGAAQGLGGALLEAFEYDDAGQLLSGSFMDYLVPTSSEVPPLHLKRLHRSLSSLNPLGAKGAGECGIAGMGGATANAVADALGEAGRKVNTLPMTPERVWTWLKAETAYQSEK